MKIKIQYRFVLDIKIFCLFSSTLLFLFYLLKVVCNNFYTFFRFSFHAMQSLDCSSYDQKRSSESMLHCLESLKKFVATPL
jgi:hypothetical protein